MKKIVGFIISTVIFQMGASGNGAGEFYQQNPGRFKSQFEYLHYLNIRSSKGIDSANAFYLQRWGSPSTYVDYLPLTGGTLSGMLTINGVDGYTSGLQLTQGDGYRHLITAYADGNNPSTGSALQFKVANDYIGGNTAVMTLKGSGYVGIGTAAPRTKLDVMGSVYINRPSAMLDGGTTIGGSVSLVPADFSASKPGYITLSYTSKGFKIGMDYDGHISTVGNDFKSILFGRGNGGDDYMIIKDGGNIGIGTTEPTEKLSVNGNIIAKKIRVTTGWSDYVFADGYDLRSLSSLEAFILKNKHLPEVPTSREVEEKGVSVGDNQALLLKKIEELTLYIINQQKQINSQNKRIRQLEYKSKHK